MNVILEEKDLPAAETEVMSHYICYGRIPGADEDTSLYLSLREDDDPHQEFATVLYSLVGVPLPDDWKERDPTPEENKHGAWVYYGTFYRIQGPPLEIL